MSSPRSVPSSPAATSLVFVYGSLKRGYWNWDRFLNHPNARFVGEAMTTHPAFTLINMGAFPGLVAGGQTRVKGEVFEVDLATLRALDRLEGHPTWYQRTEIPVRLSEPDGADLIVFTYLQPAEALQQYHQNRIIQSGEWVGDRG